ncbi:MAG: alkaline phosphatase [Clostridia bacterium]|nr:alkaline phosphatase [Clostridia bacterium]
MAQIVSFIMSIVIMITSSFGLVFEAPAEEANEFENVIIMIGDGMGWNHLYSTQNKHNVKLEMLERTEYHGFSRTRSASNLVTDSAAGGTALATGGRTMNGYIGVYPTDPLEVFATPASITEVAMSRGMSTGVVTSDAVTGATPSAFSAHERDRDMAPELFADQVASDIDLIWGSIDEETVTKEACTANGKEYVSTLSEVKALKDGQKSIGQFDSDTLWQGLDSDKDQPTLSELTTEAIEILDKDEDGFFLMVEGAHIDKRSHSQDGDGAMTAVLEFDKAISNAIDFAEKDGHTLIVISADHETGAVKPNGDGTYTWTSGSHSDTDVPVLVYGCDSFIEDGETIDNIDIPTKAVAFMTNNEIYFPAPQSYLYDEK